MKQFTPSILRCAIVAAGLIAGNAQAAYITGVTATTAMVAQAGTLISQIVDGSGLSALSLTATHASGSPTNSWGASGTTGVIDFNLNGSYNLSDLAVWNFNSINNSFGVKNLGILTSTDGTNYSPLIGAPLLFAIGAADASEAAEQFSFTPVTAAYVRFNITSNYWGSISTGLSEVAFGDSPSVPEPSVLALFAVGAAGLVAARRRKTACIDLSGF